MPIPRTKLGRPLGYIPNTPDHRDFSLLHAGAPPIKTSGAVRSNNAQYLGPVRDQGEAGSCTGHAGKGNMDFLYNRFHPLGEGKSWNFSPAYIYGLALLIDGNPGVDNGSSGRSVSKAMNKYGAAIEAADPYDDKKCFLTPPAAIQAEGVLNPSGAYHMVNNVGDIRSCIASRYPAMVGFAVYEKFEELGGLGLMPTPDFKGNEQLMGYHENYFFDYDDEKKMADGTVGGFALRNSWGVDWGANGNFWMSYKQAADPRIVQDVVMQHLGPRWG